MEHSTGLHALAEISDTFRQITDRDGLFAELTGRTARLLEAEQCAIVLRDDATGDFVCQWPAYGLTEEQVHHGRFSAAEIARLAEVMPSAGALIVEDVKQAEILSPAVIQAWGERSLMVARLQVEDRVLGGLRVANKRSGEAFTQDDGDLLGIIAGQAALAIEQMRLYQALQARSEQMAALTSIVQALNASRDVRQVFQAVAGELRRLVSFDRASIALVDDPQVPTHFTMHVVSDRPDAPLGPGQTMPLSASAAADDVLAGHMHRTDDLATEQDFPAERLLYQAGYRSRVNLPLMAEGQVIGALNLVSRQPAAFAGVDLAPLEQAVAAVAAALNQAELHERLQAGLLRRTAEAEALNAIAAAAVTAPDLQAVLDTAVERLLPALDLEAGAVYLPAPDDPETLHLVARRGLPAPFAEAVARLPADVGFTGRAYRSGKTVTLEDISAHAPERTLPVVKEYGWHAFAVVPLRFQERVLGVLTVGSRQRRLLSSEDLAFLAAAGDQLGSAVENARLRQEAEGRLREVEMLAALTQRLGESLDPPTVIQSALEQVAALAGVDGAECHLADEAGILVLAAASGLDEEFVAASHDFRFLPGEGIPGLTYAGRSLVYVPDAQSDERYLRRDLARAAGYRSLLCVPILGREALLGTFMLYSRERRAYPPEQQALLMAVGGQLAVAIERAQLHEQVKARRVEEQQTLLHLSQTLLGLLEPEAIAQAIFAVIRQHLQPDAISLLVQDADSTHLEMIAGHGWTADQVGRFRVPLAPPESSGVAWAIHTRAPLFDDFTRPDRPYTVPQVVRQAGVQTGLLVPMLLPAADDQRSGAVGVLILDSLTYRVFSEDEVRFMTLIANQTASALERARLFETERAARQRAERLQAATQALSATLDLQQVFERILSELRQIVPYDSASVQQLEGDRLEVIGGHGFPNLEELLGESFDLTAEDNPNREVIRTRAPLILDDAPALYAGFRREPHVQAGIRAWLGAPLLFGDRVIGMISLEKKEPGFYTREHARLASAFAAQAALAIEQSRLFTALRESEARYRSLFDGVPVGLYRTTPAGQILDANLAMVALLGYPDRESLLAANTAEHHVDAADRQRWQALLEETGVVHSFETHMRRRDGAIIWVQDNARAVRDDTGEILYYEGSLEDITGRKRAEESLRRRAEELEALAGVFSALRQAQTLDEMRTIILETTLQAMGAQAGIFFMFDEDMQAVYAVAAHGCSADISRLRLQMGQGLAGRCAQSGQPILIADIATDPRTVMRNAFRGLHKALCFPLPSAAGLMGVLLICFKEGGQPSPSEVNVLAAIAEMAGSALHRAALYEETERRLRLVQALRNIDMAITGSLDLRVTLDVFLDQATRQLGVDAATVLLLNPHTQVLEYAAGRGFRSRAIEGSSLRLGEGYAGRAALERRALHIPRLEEVDDYLRARLLAGEDFVGFYVTPLIVKGHVVGVFEVFHRAALRLDPIWLEFLDALAAQAAIAIDNAAMFDEVQRSNVELRLAYDTTLEGWARALELRDYETQGHSRRVTDMTLRLARAMGLRNSQLVRVRRGALLHDIGKMGIPDSILLKPGELTEEQWDIMRQHPVYAFEMLSPIAYLTPALDIPHYHHEKWDGTGYPRGLKGEQIPLPARIFAVVDVYDALLSDRPYRSAWTEEEVIAHLREQAGRHFDPQVVEIFLEMLGDGE